MTIADRYAHLSPLKRALLALDETKARLDAAERTRNGPVAIVGMGCRIPGAPNLDAFWTLLSAGGTAVREVPADRWDIDAYYDPDPAAPGRMTTRLAAFLDSVDQFDAGFFGIAPREAVSMDPQQRLLLEVVWEALEHAGIAPDGLSGTPTGVFVGVAAGDYADLMKARGDACFDGHFASGIAHSVLSGRISYLLGLQGPSVSIDTACSSSLVATHLACQSLRTGDCRMAIAGGVNLILTPDNSVLFSKTGMLAPDGRCKTFDAAADGFVRGEGCGVVVLKRLSDAQADGNRIIAVIRGSAVNQDGASSSLTAPNGPSQVAVLRAALDRAGMAAADVDYVEAHGTGTPLGDPIEVQALAAVHAGRDAGAPLRIGSLKTNVGHLEAAAGIAGLIKVVLSLQHEALPPHLNMDTPSPHVAWEDMPIEVVRRLTPWPRRGGARTAGVSSFGFSGTNAHVIVGEAPEAGGSDEAAVVDRPLHVVALSARSESALAARAGDLAEAIRAGGHALGDVAFTENTGRAHHAFRAALVAASIAELQPQLAAVGSGASAPGVSTGRTSPVDRPRVAFLFTGQGAQYAGMARVLLETEPLFRQAVDRCDAILQPLLGRSIVSVLDPAPGEPSLIDETAWTQPALFVVDYALAQLWKTWGVEPAVVMGHSLGEVVAACVAGVFSLEDALTIVAARGRLMQQLPANGEMASVFAEADRVAEAVRPFADSVSIAAMNEPAQTVVSGERTAVAAVLDALAAQGVKARRLAVSHAFHSPLMAPMLEEFAAVLRRVSFAPPRVSIVSNVTGRVAGPDEMSGPDYWLRHVMAPVRFAESVATLTRMGVRVFVEAGPTPTLLAMAGRCVPEVEGTHWLPSLRKGKNDWTPLLESLARLYVLGVPIDWRGFDRGRRRLPLALPTYPFERERYWIAPAAPRARVEDAAPAHPLLHRPVRIAGTSRVAFDTTVTRATLPWLFDHRVHGEVIVPGAAFVEMGFEAARARWGGDGHVVRDVSMHQVLAIDEERETTWQVVIDDLEDGRASFQVFTVPADAATSDWSLHAEGTIVRADRVEPAPVAAASYEETRARTTDERAPADHYQDLHDRGLDLGEAFRGLSDLRRTDGEAVARIELPAGVDATGYVLHPVLLDLAIQALGAAIEEGRVAAGVSFLPVALGRARHHAALAPAWVHAVVRAAERSPDTIVADVVVRASDGQPVASLEALRLKRADRAAMTRRHLSAIRSWFYEVQWQPGGGATRAAVADHVPSPANLAGSMATRVDAIAREQGLDAFEAGLAEVEALSTAFVSDAVAALGAGLRVGDRIDESALAARVVPAQRRLLRRLLEILGEDGLLRRDADGWVVASTPPRREVGDWLAAIQRDFGVPLQAELALLERCGPKLADVLEGRADPLALLFPGGSSHLAENLYQVSPAARTFNQLLAEALQQVLDALPEGRTVRILEIGGGTGSTSSFLLPRLRPGQTDYVFTDVSAAFTTRAAEKFAAFPFVQYRTLDIERDPMGQGFAGESFDVIVAANVLHATRDLDETFGHVRRLLAPEGLLVMLEMVRPQRWIDLTFGLTDGWWRFTDAARRPSYPLLGHEGWRTFLASHGFRDIAAVPGREGDGVLAIESAVIAVGPPARAGAADASGRWLIVGGACQSARAIADRIEARGGRCTIAVEDTAAAAAAFAGGGADARGVVHAVALDTDDVGVGSLEQLRASEAAIGESALTLIQTLAAAGVAAPVTFVTRGAQAVSADDAPAFVQAPLWGLAKVAALEHPELVCRRVDLDGSDASFEWLVDDLLTAGTSNEDQVAYRAGRTWVPRLVRRAATAAGVPAAAEPAEPTRLHVAKRGAIDGLARVPAARRAPDAGEVEVRVRVAALNFRDVMNVLGLYPGDPGPLGNECAGIVTRVGSGVDLRVGDEVVGLAAGSFADYVTAPAAFLVRRPPSLEAEDAVTLPIAYVTAYFALHHLAHMKAGDRVLIHAAAGGVGLAAVHLALRAGADVFATAGSAEKQAYLASLGVAHVMSSRTPQFRAEVLARTKRRGVDIVLNSLKGELIGASFDALVDGGTFLEIGKSGWTPAQVAARGKGVDYHVIDWGEQARTHPDLIRSMIGDLVERVATGELPALPRTVFPIEAAPEAFRYMAQARHTGKVLLAMPAPGETTPLVRPDGSYLVTGGLNGLGWLTATWLADQGARHLILMARSAPSADVVQAITDLERRGVQVLVSRGDVSVEADVEAALALAGGSRPPLRGIVHSAGVLDDGALMQQDWARFESVLAPKFAGAWNLDRSTRDQPLDFFVLYSSVAAIFGSRGQANHAAANTGMDALVHARRVAGRVGQSINWGVWSEVGAAVQRGVDRRVGGHGIGTIDPARGLAALEYLLRSRDAQTTVFPVDWVRYAEQFNGRRVPPFLSQVVVDTAPAREARTAVAAPAADSVPVLVGLVARTPVDGRRRAILMHVRDCATRVLGLPSSRAIDARQPLNELGLDSLMAVELRNVLGAAVGRTLPATLLFDYPTAEALTTFLHDSLIEAPAASRDDLDEGDRRAAPDEVGGAHVLDRIEDLSDEEVDRLLADRLAGKRQT